MSRADLPRADGSRIWLEKEEQGSLTLGIVFAGFGYSCDQPLLYYSRRLLAQRGFDHWALDLGYLDHLAFQALDEVGQAAYLLEDKRRIAEYVKSRASQYRRLFLIGKSLGTSVIRHLLADEEIRAKSALVLLTPGRDWPDFIPELANYDLPLLVIGSLGDGNFPVDGLKRLRGLSRTRILELPQGDHSLETGEVQRDLAIMGRVMQVEAQFLEEAQP